MENNNYNQNNTQNYNQEYNGYNGQNYNQSYGGESPDTYGQPWQYGVDRGVKKKNNTLLVVTLIIAVITLISCIVLAVMLFNRQGEGNDKPAKDAAVTKTDEKQKKVEEEPVPEEEPLPQEEPEDKTIPVGRTMYVLVNDYLILRSGPGTGYSEKGRMYRGDAVYVKEYVNDEFASVTYNGVYGYAARKYLTDSQPAPIYRWNYSTSEIDSIVVQSLNWYVNAVNTGYTGGAERYFAGKIRQTEINNASSMANKVAGERLLSVRCHSHKRLSPTRVSVVRQSDIEVTELNGNSRVASERRVYVLENTGNGTYIVDIHS